MGIGPGWLSSRRKAAFSVLLLGSAPSLFPNQSATASAWATGFEGDGPSGSTDRRFLIVSLPPPLLFTPFFLFPPRNSATLRQVSLFRSGSRDLSGSDCFFLLSTVYREGSDIEPWIRPFSIGMVRTNPRFYDV